jgi:hypothetical protein
MSLKGWAELVHEKRVKDLAEMRPEMRKAQVLLWIAEDSIGYEKARSLWPDYISSPADLGEVEKVIEEREARSQAEAEARDAKHRYEYEVVNMRCGEDATPVINAYAQEGWRLHTYSQTALDGGGFMAGWMKAFGGPGLALVNILTLVFERDRRNT